MLLKRICYKYVYYSFVSAKISRPAIRKSQYNQRQLRYSLALPLNLGYLVNKRFEILTLTCLRNRQGFNISSYGHIISVVWNLGLHIKKTNIWSYLSNCNVKIRNLIRLVSNLIKVIIGITVFKENSKKHESLMYFSVCCMYGKICFIDKSNTESQIILERNIYKQGKQK